MKSENKIKIGPTQIKFYRAYERVRASGKFNMYDSRAFQASGLTDEQYTFVMEHFGELRQASLLAEEKGK